MNNGWIKIHRGLLNWQWHDDPEMLSLWMTLLMMASYEDKDCDGVPIGRGQIKTTLNNLSLQTGITQKKLRCRLERLSKVDCIRKETANGYTIITVCNYDSYQTEEDKGQRKGTEKGKEKGSEKAQKRAKDYATITACNCDSYQQEEIDKGTAKGNERAQERAQEWAAKGHTLYILKEEKNIKENNLKESTLSCTKEIAISLTQSKNEDVCSCLPDAKVNPNVNVKSSTPPPPSKPQKPTISVEDRRRDFAETIKPYVATYGRDMCNDFFAYWTEMSTQGRKMRFEKERTWSLSRRLATWYGNDFGRKKDLPPEIQATLPSLFDNEATTDKKKVIEDKLKEITAKYNIKGDDGEMYCSESDARYHDHPLSVVLEVERARLEKELK